jgi:hypothetical protein
MPTAFTAPVSPLPNELVLSSVLTFIAAAQLHAKVEKSIANAVLGLLHSERLSVTAIGTAWARVTNHDARHGVKQVDRLASNPNFRLEDCLRAHVRNVVAQRRAIVTALDWTEFALDGQATICLYLITNHGRATPLVWKTVALSAMKDRRNSFEDELLQLFERCLPTDRKVRVVVLADRGFGDVALYSELKNDLGFDFVIRFRKNVYVEHGGRRQSAAEWLEQRGGRMLQLRHAKLTGRFKEVESFVAVHDRLMAEPWFLATSLTGGGKAIARLYGKRFTIEETFRDQKDMRFGWGLYDVQVTQPERRDRLLFLAAVAQLLLTLTGAAGEEIGLDAKLRVNTERTRRTHSLLRQGREYVKGLVACVATKVRHEFVALLATLPNTTATYAIV